jgi:RNA polymerase sigma factor (sigma-70 family)
VAQGEPQAVQQCIDAHGPLVWSLARRMCPSGIDAEDLVQEIFIALWKSAHRYDPAVASESTWVATVARRRLIDARRRAARREEDAELPTDLPTTDEEHTERAQRDDEAERARKAFEALRVEQRRVLELALLGGLTYDEVARKLTLPLGTVKSHARRGLIRVRELLGLRTARGEVTG